MTALLTLLLAMNTAPVAPGDDFQTRILAAHNAVRAEVGTPPLAWSDRLADRARAWADSLAAAGRFQHDDQGEDGENLWMGTAGYFTLEQMVGGWTDERAAYRHGPFLDVAQDGKVVGHYTQMVWRSTTEVGCATARTASHDILVCRYSPPGNWIGQTAY